MLIVSCAQVVAPNGGKADTTPPKVLNTLPINKSVNFTSKKIEFVFDEYIQLKDAQKQILISPPMKNFPELKVKGKKLTMEIVDTLKTNTTYTIGFGNAITDITENNPIVDFKYVFSTDSILDTLKLSGIITNAFTKLPDENMLVALYNNNSKNIDSCAQKNLPDYFAKTNKSGSYIIENIHQGQYFISAFADANSDYLYQSDDEKMAFADTVINIKNTDLKVDLNSFLAEPAKLLIKKATPSINNLQIELNKKPIRKINITTIQNLPNNWAIIEHNKYYDSLKVWFTAKTLLLDSLNIIVSEGSNTIDTIDINLKSLRNNTSGGRGAKQQLILAPNNLFSGKLLLPKTALILKSTMPVATLNDSKILILHLNDTLKSEVQKVDSLGRTFKIISDFAIDSSYILKLKQTAFTSINGLESDTSKISFTIQNPKEIGALKLQIICPDSLLQYIFQITNEQNMLVDEQTIINKKTFDYKQLQPGKYNLKLIADNNKNGHWDTGNYNKKLQPEKIYNYTGSLVVRANWDVDETWDLTNKKLITK